MGADQKGAAAAALPPAGQGQGSSSKAESKVAVAAHAREPRAVTTGCEFLMWSPQVAANIRTLTLAVQSAKRRDTYLGRD